MLDRILRMRNKKILVGIIIGLGLFTLMYPRITLSTVSNYQGIHPSFEAIYFKGQLYTAEDIYDASTCRIHPSSFDFDPDIHDTGYPNLRGELRDIQIIRDLASYEVGDTLSHIVSMGGENAMPYKVYEWEVETENLTHVYRMENWLCSMEVNLWADPDSRDWLKLFQVYEKTMTYPSTEIWLKLTPAPSWYFEGADEVYFGLGYMELALMTFEDGHENPRVEVMPESRWASYSLYNSLNGFQEYVENPISQAKSYEGDLLNPDVFRDEWYFPITVDNFGCFDYNMWDGSYTSDSIQQKILVHIFVVGEWIVQPDIEHDMEEHDSSEYVGPLTQLANNLSDLISNPFFGVGLGSLGIGLFAFALFWVFGMPKFLKKGGES